MEVLLGSKSPRRKDLLQGAGINFTLINIDVKEDYPNSIALEDVAEFLACKKSEGYTQNLYNKILLTADTTVLLEGEIINKPKDLNDAIVMLKKMSGKMHTVFTGVCLRTEKEKISFTDKTNVYFKDLTTEQIKYYIENFNPLDKAGAYGIQDWIGYVGVSKIDGDFFNAMGLPINRVYEALQTLGH